MEQERLRDVSFDRLGSGYATQWEWMDDLFAWLDLRLYFFYKHHQWLGPKNDLRNMLGLVVGREEFEHNLAKSAQRGLASMLEPEDAEQIEDSGGRSRSGWKGRRRISRCGCCFPAAIWMDSSRTV